MHDKILYVLMQKKRGFYQIKYFKYPKFKIKLKKTTSLFVYFSTFTLAFRNMQTAINK
jgi:hypothetical protein